MHHDGSTITKFVNGWVSRRTRDYRVAVPCRPQPGQPRSVSSMRGSTSPHGEIRNPSVSSIISANRFVTLSGTGHLLLTATLLADRSLNRCSGSWEPEQRGRRRSTCPRNNAQFPAGKKVGTVSLSAVSADALRLNGRFNFSRQ